MTRISKRLASHSRAGRRTLNEDSSTTLALGKGHFAVAVADGIGGHRAGDVASQTAIAAFEAEVTKGTTGVGESTLKAAFTAAAAAVTEVALCSPDHKGMGTTFVAALGDAESLYVVHAGDSRAMLILPKRVVRLTEDHTAASDALREGKITEEEARTHPYRHAVTRSLGEGPVDPDFQRVPSVLWSTNPGAVLLLGSDGLFNFLSDAELHAAFREGATLAEAVSSLVDLALANGSDDNVTAAAAELGKWSWKRKSTGGLLVGALGVLGLVVALIIAGLLWEGDVGSPAQPPPSTPRIPAEQEATPTVVPAPPSTAIDNAPRQLDKDWKPRPEAPPAVARAAEDRPPQSPPRPEAQARKEEPTKDARQRPGATASSAPPITSANRPSAPAPAPTTKPASSPPPPQQSERIPIEGAAVTTPPRSVTNAGPPPTAGPSSPKESDSAGEPERVLPLRMEVSYPSTMRRAVSARFKLLRGQASEMTFTSSTQIPNDLKSAIAKGIEASPFVGDFGERRLPYSGTMEMNCIFPTRSSSGQCEFKVVH